ncbi:MAG: hypothetical protein WCB68_01480 [Pyrinomonadaceae bacterium]
MKRLIPLLFALVLCVCATQPIFAQRAAQKAPQAPIEPIDPCPECDPPPPGCGQNPIDDATFFVQQQYRDFLYREATGAELINDLPPLNSCLHRGDFACYNTERVKMSRRMWDKAEFRQQSRTFGLPLTGDFQFEHYNDDDFVELEYLIYLQRPSSAPPDDYRRLGYFFWLNSLNGCVSGSTSFDQSSQCYNDSINAFLQSTEYRSRFSCQ